MNIFENYLTKINSIITENRDLLDLKNFKNLKRWYSEISKREAVIKGFDFMNRGEVIPKP